MIWHPELTEVGRKICPSSGSLEGAVRASELELVFMEIERTGDFFYQAGASMHAEVGAYYMVDVVVIEVMALATCFIYA